MPQTSSEKQPKVVYEWIVTMSKGDEIILTENQYDFLKKKSEEGDNRKLFFGDVAINPSFVVSAYRQKAVYIKNKYPCPVCYQSGKKPNGELCDNCEGSGVQLPA